MSLAYTAPTTLSPAAQVGLEVLVPDPRDHYRCPLRNGDRYFVLLFPDGTPRDSVARFRYDPLRAVSLLRGMGYTVRAGTDLVARSR